MAGHYIKGRAVSAAWGWRSGTLALATLIVAVAFFRLKLLDPLTLTWTLAVAAGFAALALLLSAHAVLRVWRRGDRGGGRALAAFALGLVVAIPFVGLLYLFDRYPDGNAAQTSGVLAPIQGAPGGAPAEPLAPPERALLPAKDYQATAATVYGAARQVLTASGMDVVEVETSATPKPAEGDLGVAGTVAVPLPTPRDSVNRSAEYDPAATADADGYLIRAVAYAPLLGFPSDVTIRIVEENGVAYVDMRSVSQTLARDLGENRRIIQTFLARLDAAMQALQDVAVPEN